MKIVIGGAWDRMEERVEEGIESGQERLRQIPCSRDDILEAERAFYGNRVWKGKPMMGFGRWMGMDNLLHAVVVLDGGIRVHLDERDQRDVSGRTKAAFRWWA